MKIPGRVVPRESMRKTLVIALALGLLVGCRRSERITVTREIDVPPRPTAVVDAGTTEASSRDEDPRTPSGALASAERAETRDRVIWVVDAKGGATRLTSGGKDAAPLLSPDRRALVYERVVVPMTNDGAPSDTRDELWIVRENELPRRLVEGRIAWEHGESQEQHLADMFPLQFSLDSRTLYFASSAWAVSGSLHAVDVVSGAERFVSDGSLALVVPSGAFRGHLVVETSRIEVDAHGASLGRGMQFFLVTPAGKVVRQLKTLTTPVMAAGVLKALGT
jgi:hypothetical protein